MQAEDSEEQSRLKRSRVDDTVNGREQHSELEQAGLAELTHDDILALVDAAPRHPHREHAVYLVLSCSARQRPTDVWSFPV